MRQDPWHYRAMRECNNKNNNIIWSISYMYAITTTTQKKRTFLQLKKVFKNDILIFLNKMNMIKKYILSRLSFFHCLISLPFFYNFLYLLSYVSNFIINIQEKKSYFEVIGNNSWTKAKDKYANFMKNC